MLNRALIRCPACRTAVPAAVLWAAGDICPGCSRPLAAAQRPPVEEAAIARTRALIDAPATDLRRRAARAHPLHGSNVPSSGSASSA